MSEAQSVSSGLPMHLDMGIWWNDGEKLWLPKEFYPTRNDAKRFAIAECYSDWINVRVRTVWVQEVPDTFWPDEFSYLRTESHAPGAFECWEVDT